VILFIHGFASCGLGDKSRVLIDHYGRDQVLTPDLAPDPALAVAQLETLQRRHPVNLLIGSSLGGHYATRLNRRQPVPTVLINPAVQPARLLEPYIGPHRRWCDGARFELTRQHIATLAAQYRPTLGPAERYLVLLQAGDEVLDYRTAAAYYRAHQVVLQPGGNHRFENLADYLDRIDAFRQAAAETP
jgi:predicted esterase YcpF (UPF0227 family)